MANFCTWNPLRVNTTAALSSVGNLLATMNTNNQAAIAGTIDVVSGKWYWEVLINQNAAFVGVTVSTYNGYANITGIDGSLHYYASNGNIYEGTGGASTNTAYGATSGDGDVIGVALNMDDRTIAFYKNGTLLAAAVSLPHTGVGYTPSFSTGTSGAVVTGMANFGQFPWRYDPPSGFIALSTGNLAEPPISNLAAEKPEDYFNTVLYTGNGGTQSITGVGFQPDLVWIKERSQSNDHVLIDAVRGIDRRLESNNTDAEVTMSPVNLLTSLDSDGFSLGSNGNANENTETYVAWCWKAGGTAVENTDGSITSTVSANTESGFSIVSYTGTGGSGPNEETVGHGLNSAPEFFLVKCRSNSYVWWGGVTFIDGSMDVLQLQSTIAKADSTNNVPTSSIFNAGGTSLNGNGETYIAYCFHSVEGFSKFGTYTGNGSTDGPFVYTGFRPALVIAKQTDASRDWIIKDNQRPTYNPASSSLYPNLSNSAGSGEDIDLLSNGFKIRTTNGKFNISGGTYVYMAFAEQPLKYSSAR